MTSVILGGMDDARHDLWMAIIRGDAEEVRQQLAAAPDPAALVAAADEAHSVNAVHCAAAQNNHNLELLRLLLQASPSAAAACTAAGDTPLHRAARDYRPCAGAVRLLLEAAPASAAARNHEGQTPFEWLCRHWRIAGFNEDRCCAARLLMAGCGLQPSQLLESLRSSLNHSRPLFVDVIAGHPLTAADWQLVPSPCPGLAAALPAVLERSPAEAALLVARLPAAQRHCLHTAALCLHRAQVVAGATLPLPLVWRILVAFHVLTHTRLPASKCLSLLPSLDVRC